MGLFIKKFSVYPNQKGFLYFRNTLQKELEPGIYRKIDPLSHYSCYTIPTTTRWFDVSGQEVLCKDSVSLRFSYSVVYQITEPAQLIQQIDLIGKHTYIDMLINTVIHTVSQKVIRDRIAEVTSEELNDTRAELFDSIAESLQAEIKDYGITITKVFLRDISFPKAIQELFAKQLEAKIRARADLENARTAVAAARALKNASEIIKDDPNIKFFQYLETVTKIAARGKHTFVVGDVNGVNLK